MVKVVNGLPDFIERPLLHKTAVGLATKQRSLQHMLRGTKVQFIQAWATELDPVAKLARVDTGKKEMELSYDYLIYALGSSVNRGTVPGVDQYAYTLDPYGRHSTQDLQERLQRQSVVGGRVAIVGGGPTGIEAATEIKSQFRVLDVILIAQGRAGAFKGEKVRQHIAGALVAQNIEVREGQRVRRIDERFIQLPSEKIAADIIIWAGGFVASPLAAAAGITVNERRQILVDPTLRSLSHPDIFAVGDSALAVEEPGAPMRMSLYVAIVSGAQAADNLSAILKGKRPRPLSYAWYGQGIALGQQDAVGFLTYPADALSGPILRGRLAVHVRSFFVWLLGASLEIERRFPGFLFWNGRNRYAKQQEKSMHLQDQKLSTF